MLTPLSWPPPAAAEGQHYELRTADLALPLRGPPGSPSSSPTCRERDALELGGVLSSARPRGPRRVVAPGSKLGKHDWRERGVGAEWGMPSVF